MGKPIVATDADGLLDVLHRSAGRAGRAQGATPRRWRAAIIRADRATRRWRRGWPPSARATGARYDIGVFVRKMERLYELLHETSRRDRAPGHPRGRPRRSCTRAAPRDRCERRASEAWRLGAASTAMLGVVLLGWALTVDFPKLSYGVLRRRGHLLQPRPQPRRRLRLRVPARGSRARVARVPERARRHLPEARPRPRPAPATARRRSCTSTRGPTPTRPRLYFAKAFIYPLFAAPFVWLFGTNGFLVLHALLMTVCFLCAYAFLVARSHPVAGADLRRARSCSSRSCRSTWCGSTPDFFNLGAGPAWLFLLVLQGSRRRRPARRGAARDRRWLLGAALRRGRRGLARHRDLLQADAHAADAAAAGARSRCGGSGARGARRRAGVRARSWSALFALNIAVTGEWNYQGGERKTFYSGGDVARAFRSRPTTARSTRPGSAAPPTACRSRCWPPATRWSTCSATTSATSSSAATPALPSISCRGWWRSCCSSPRDARARDVAVADAGRRRRLGGGADALHAVHLVGRRRAGRQSLFPRRLPGVPVPGAAAGRRPWPAWWRLRRSARCSSRRC